MMISRGSFDPRLKILLAVLLAVLAWRAGAAGLLLYLSGLGIVLLLALDRAAAGRGALRAGASFVLVWALLKWGFDWLNGSPGFRALEEGALFGLRLAVLIGIGLALTATSSPRALGLAFAWFLRPLLRDRAWRAALALSLMLHYLPLTLRTLSTVRTTIRRRCPDLSLPRRLHLLAEASLRALSLKTWDQTLAVAARGLDRPEAWKGRLHWRLSEATAGILLAITVVGAASL